MTEITVSKEALHEYVGAVIAFIDELNDSSLLDALDEDDELFVLGARIDTVFAALEASTQSRVAS